MKGPLVTILALMVWSLAGAPADAATGNGLYAPFPQKASENRAERYLERLPAGLPASLDRLTREELERGIFVGGEGRVATSRGPSERAGVASRSSPGLPWTVQLLLVAMAVGAGALLLARRPGPGS